MPTEFHEIANSFPLMIDAELQALADDIRNNGLLEPITLFEGKILDGRNRYLACALAGIEPAFEEYAGSSPIAFVVSKNIQRRHLTESQRAMVAANLANMKRGGDGSNQYESKSANLQNSISQADAAKLLSVSPRLVADAVKIRNEAPEFVPAIEAGGVTINAVNRELKKQELQASPPLPTEGKYRIIYADPPWKYSDSGLDNYGPAERHYPAMTIEQLCALPIKDMAEDNSVLFLWVTSPMLEVAFDVIRAWSFSYKSSFVWDKVRHNFGHYNSVRHEYLLICTCGSCTPDSDEKIDSVQVIERSVKHSEKPEEFRAIIDRLYTHGKRIELFARGEVPVSWERWGNE